MKNFDELKNGDKIHSIDGYDYTMEVMLSDFYGNGEKILCFADDTSIFPACQFDPADWEVVTA